MSGVLSAGMPAVLWGRRSVAVGRGLWDEWGGQGALEAFVYNFTFFLKFQVAPCTRHPALYLWSEIGAGLDPTLVQAPGVHRIPGLISVALPHQ